VFIELDLVSRLEDLNHCGSIEWCENISSNKQTWTIGFFTTFKLVSGLKNWRKFPIATHLSCNRSLVINEQIGLPLPGRIVCGVNQKADLNFYLEKMSP